MPCSSMLLAAATKSHWILFLHSMQVQYLQGMPALTQAHLLFLHPFVQLHVSFSRRNKVVAAYSRAIGHRNTTFFYFHPYRLGLRSLRSHEWIWRYTFNACMHVGLLLLPLAANGIFFLRFFLYRKQLAPTKKFSLSHLKYPPEVAIE